MAVKKVNGKTEEKKEKEEFIPGINDVIEENKLKEKMTNEEIDKKIIQEKAEISDAQEKVEKHLKDKNSSIDNNENITEEKPIDIDLDLDQWLNSGIIGILSKYIDVQSILLAFGEAVPPIKTTDDLIKFSAKDINKVAENLQKSFGILFDKIIENQNSKAKTFLQEDIKHTDEEKKLLNFARMVISNHTLHNLLVDIVYNITKIIEAKMTMISTKKYISPENSIGKIALFDDMFPRKRVETILSSIWDMMNCDGFFQIKLNDDDDCSDDDDDCNDDDDDCSDDDDDCSDNDE